MIKPMKRLSEPSSWAGLGGLAMLFGMNFPDAFWSNVSQVVAGLSFVVSYLRKEFGSPD